MNCLLVASRQDLVVRYQTASVKMPSALVHEDTLLLLDSVVSFYQVVMEIKKITYICYFVESKA